ncbi:MAG: 50S ribosomal protein L3 [Candidatus Parcubacteria bacterium]|nr:50S ribosomal protein L3 [Candidatus Parcubacteria bacterium]
MKFILGKKIEMTQLFDKEGQAVPVTFVQAGPCFVTQKKTKEKDGYESLQIGFGEVKLRKLTKPEQGHLKGKALKHLREFPSAGLDLEVGSEIKADIFKEGDPVKVVGTSKGKGFAGVVKRHHFGGGPASHGQKHSLRAPGSIGATFPERVPKGRRMGGRMGNERVTVEGLKIFKMDAENNILAITGAIPGIRGALLEIISEE